MQAVRNFRIWSDKGDARPDSDVDLLLIVNQVHLTEKERQDIINPLFEMKYETGVLINPVVVLKNNGKHAQRLFTRM